MIEVHQQVFLKKKKTLLTKCISGIRSDKEAGSDSVNTLLFNQLVHVALPL